MNRLVVVSVVLLCVALVACAASAATVSVGLSPDVKAPTDQDKKVVDATKTLFQEKGYRVVEGQADYNVVTSLTQISGEKKFSPLGCLACGIFGAAKQKASATVATEVTDGSGKQVFVNTQKATSEGSELGGLFESSKKYRGRAIDEALKQLYTAFFIQHPASG